MIRNVVLGRLRPGADRAVVEQALAGIVALPVEGRLDVHVGFDAGLRAGNWDYVITADFVDAAAYRAYDLEPEHNRLREQAFVPQSQQIARLQYEI